MGQIVEKREAKRHQIEAPIELARGTGVTRDFSYSGVYFTTKENYQKGEFLDFMFNLKYAFPDREIPLKCYAEIVRVEKVGNQYGVAVKLANIEYVH